ncbi:MAG TPA: Smr/MutS family protein [Amaricoccus sp.]|nr:Smr/MutS family protein [Amaricoccus sp.]
MTAPSPPAAKVRRPAAVPALPDPHGALERAHPHMDRRRFDKLRRGKLDPEARIDLHGMTSERAHAALGGFIRDAFARELRLVLVITGKGRPDEAAVGPRRHGILRHSLPHWLTAPPLGGMILQVTGAHQRHGGAGAFYVYLRRRRE